MHSKSLEPEVRPAPSWLAKSVIYQIFLRAFTPEGTLAAATQRLPDLATLGVNIVYLCPICLHDDDPREEFWSDRQRASGCGNPRNPYRIKDYFAIDPEYGSDEDLHEFVSAAHGLGIRVMLDIVYLHCGPTAVFLDEHPEFVDRSEHGEIKPGPWHFPMLNFESSELREYLLGNLEYWVSSFDVDGYRCDVSGSIPLDFWEKAYRRVKTIKSEFIWLSEGRRRDDQLVAFDLNYSFEQNTRLYELMEGEATAADYRRRWEEMNAQWPTGTRFIRYTDNHDLANDHPERLERIWGPEAVRATLVLMFTLDGVPMLYNGQEIADRAQHSIYAKWPIDWENADTSEGKKRHEFVRRLCSLRREIPELYDGALRWLENDHPDEVLSFVRQREGNGVLVVVNLSDRALEVAVEVDGMVDGSGAILSEGARVIESGRPRRASLAPFGYHVGR